MENKHDFCHGVSVLCVWNGVVDNNSLLGKIHRTSLFAFQGLISGTAFQIEFSGTAILTFSFVTNVFHSS